MIAALLQVAIACAAPWAFGAVEPRWWGMAATAALVVALFPLVAAVIRGSPRDELPLPLRRLVVALPLVAAIGLLPTHPRMRRIFSPTASAVLEDADPSSAGEWRALSLDPHATLGAVIVAAACAAVFWVVARAARDERRARALVAVLLAGGAALALFGLWHRLFHYDQQAVFWGAFRVALPDVATPFGPYVNRNHFAGAMLAFAGLGAGATLNAAASRRWTGIAAPLAATIACVVALAATTSRGGLVGLAVGALFLAFASGSGQRSRAVASVLVAGAVVVAVLASFGLLDDLVARVHIGLEGRERNRFAVQWDALKVFAGNPVFGTGAGTFASAYPPFQTIDDVRFFSNAHSDWAQFLMETGLVGAVFAAACAREFGGRVRRAAARSDSPRWLVVGPAAGCIAMSVHGLFDTNLHVPANALLFTLALSLACAASVRQDVDTESSQPVAQGAEGRPSKDT